MDELNGGSTPETIKATATKSGYVTPAKRRLNEFPPRPSYLGHGIHTVHCARVAHVCESCGERIPKGSLYVRHALPPNSELGNVGWLNLVSCGWTTGECRRYWEIDAKDLRGEPHVIPS